MPLRRSLLAVGASLILLGAGCNSAEQANVTTPKDSPGANTEVTETAETTVTEPSPTPTQPEATKPTVEVGARVDVNVGGAPVQFTALGIDPNSSKYGLFKIKILADNVTQVDIAFKSFDADGAVVRETTYGWQNIVNGEQKAIIKGQTYADKYVAGAGSVKTEARVARVMFEDGSSWTGN